MIGLTLLVLQGRICAGGGDGSLELADFIVCPVDNSEDNLDIPKHLEVDKEKVETQSDLQRYLGKDWTDCMVLWVRSDVSVGSLYDFYEGLQSGGETDR